MPARSGFAPDSVSREKVVRRGLDLTPEAAMPTPARVPGHGGRYRFREYEPHDRKVVGILRAIAHHEEPTEEWGKPPSDAVRHITVVVADCEENHRVVAAARVIANDDRVAHLQFVSVEEERRGIGLGGALLDWIETASRDEWGHRVVELEVERHNSRAMTFYERKGYAHREDYSAVARVCSENPMVRRMLGPPRVLRFVKSLKHASDENPSAGASA